MDLISVSTEDGLAVVRLNRPKAHALNHNLVIALREAVDTLGQDDVHAGMILTAEGGIFSAGLDVVELFDYDEDKIDQFWRDFSGLIRQLAGCPKPTVCAVNGHAPAGGCVLALCCDYRVMAQGKARIGLNEVAVGVVLPEALYALSRFAVGDHRAEKMIYSAQLFEPKDAQDYGLVDEICEPDDLMDRARTQAAFWAGMPEAPQRHAKLSARRLLLEELDMPFEQGYGNTIKEWWSVSSRAQVAKLVDRLKKSS